MGFVPHTGHVRIDSCGVRAAARHPPCLVQPIWDGTIATGESTRLMASRDARAAAPEPTSGFEQALALTQESASRWTAKRKWKIVHRLYNAVTQDETQLDTDVYDSDEEKEEESLVSDDLAKRLRQVVQTADSVS